MEVWINGRKVGGDVSTNPTKVKKDVGGVGKPTIDDGTGRQVPLVGKVLYTGGISWTKPVADISEYLVDGRTGSSSSTARPWATSSSTGVGAVKASTAQLVEEHPGLPSYGPRQAKMVPFVEAHYVSQNGGVGGGVGGTVPATLALTLGAPGAFGAFVPGLDRSYDASTTATVTSTAGDATLSVTDPSATATGRLVNGSFALGEQLQVRANTNAFAPLSATAGSPLALLSYSGPVSNDSVTLGFRQHIGASQALRTGSYSKTLTFTLSTTTP